MRILVLSNTPWSTDNCFGNSFSNIFGGISGIEIANIYCRYGQPNNPIVKKYYQITEKSLIKNLINRKNPSGSEIKDLGQSFSLDESGQKVFNYLRNNRSQFYFWARDFIWAIGRWRSEKLKKFIRDFNPDIIFQPLYYSLYLNRIALFLKEFTGVPLVCYVSDDVYTLRQLSFSPLYWIDRFMKRRIIKRLVNQCERIYVISDIQKREYEKCFHKECRILTKGADFSCYPREKHNIHRPLKLAYTGNVGGGRWRSLHRMGRVLSEINKDGVKAQLYIYSMTPLTKRMKKAMHDEKSIFFMGGVSSEVVPAIQSDADVLVHVEPTDLRGRLQVHQSFSTKIVDYLHSNRCIFAVGTPDVASIDYLIKNEAGVVATTEQEIYDRLSELLAHPEIIHEYAKRAWNCGSRNHQINIIQEQLYEDLTRLVKGKQDESIAYKCD
ncbi:glycosyltransferase [Heliobacterium chlorum]|uniref:Glycosyltransferase n=1 Tax=Heliobacterium chlorum TaxID=2698 RepID=A0ABR7T4X3_HELCL|nr:glycosyltransferase [Heliobacterium chlorum]MBC9785833.1 glycosyltransferase [Heliobacterium chlorum]